MTSERWQRIEELCHAALDRAPAERGAFLSTACAGDSDLRREVEALLAHAPAADRFLAEAIPAVAAHTFASGVTDLVGRRIGEYEILSRLGAGGMGEVYRARDSKLGRDVAIKVLPSAFTADRDRLARFEREARVLASLNHPNVGAIYGVEEFEGLHALVLELVEGDTLGERIGGRSSDGPIAIAEAVAIARQIAEALEAAHEKGIVHRDLKPANIKVTPAGTVKVLDFGLAKSGAGSAPDLSHSPTITIGGTRDGVLLGTAAYMSPEQARGQSVDKRSDIWAFGCVLFEMLTGRMAFPGATVSDHIAAILEREPDWSAVPASTPQAIQRLLRWCLEKDPKRRVHDIADARIEIENASTAPAPHPSRRASSRLPWSLAAVLVAMLLGSIVWSLRRPAEPPPPQLTRFALQPPAGWPNISRFALSSDGSQIVFAAQESSGTQPRLFLRRVDEFDARPLAGTEGGNDPFFSPDGQWIGFSTGDSLKKVSTTAPASPIALAKMGNILRATWTTENSIIVSTQDHGLQHVPPTGGPATPVTTLDASRRERDHHNPELLPGGKALLFTIHEVNEAGDNVFRVGVQLLATGERRVLIDQGFDAHYLPTGHLVYANGSSVLAVPFNARTLQVGRDPVNVMDDVATVPDSGNGAFCVSATGSLVFLPGRPRIAKRALVWVDRAGAEQEVPIARRPFTISRLSPDGRQIAFTVVTPGGTGDVWTYDIATERSTRVSFESFSVAPVWTPDGKRITYTTSEKDLWQLMSVPADGSRSPQSLVTSRNQIYPATWTPDDRTLVYYELLAGRNQIVALDPDGASRPVAATHGPAFANVSGPAVSPDGRWLALVGIEKGQTVGNIYVEPFQRPGPRYQVTVDGGIQPLWRHDGREIFYRNGDGVYAVPVETSREFVAKKPVLLFRGPYRRGSPNTPDYDVSPDGRRFLMVRLSEDETAPRRLNVVVNWADGLLRHMPSVK